MFINNSYSRLIIFSSADNTKSSFSFNIGFINLSQLASVCFLMYPNSSFTYGRFPLDTSIKYPNTLLNPTFKFFIPVFSLSACS